MNYCSHVAEMQNVEPATAGCGECLKIGSSWVHLRLCQTCGSVGCCDSSANRHASKHFAASGHPIISSLEPGESWGYCFVDDRFYQELPAV